MPNTYLHTSNSQVWFIPEVIVTDSWSRNKAVGLLTIAGMLPLSEIKSDFHGPHKIIL